MSVAPEAPRPPSHVLEIVLVCTALITGAALAIYGAATTPPLARARQAGAGPQGVVTPPVQPDEGSPAEDGSEDESTDPIRLINGRATAEAVDFDCHQLSLTFSWDLHPSEELLEPEKAILRVTGPVLQRREETIAGFDGITQQHATIVPDGSHKWTADVIRVGGRPAIAPKVTARFRTSC